jgi:Zn-dependent protease with chaperone function
MQAPAAGWPAWRPAERESFFVAVARHRRAAWRVTAVCAVAIAVLIAAVAILMAPLLYGLLFITADLLNLVVPTRDLFAPAAHELGVLLNHPQSVTLGRWIDAAALAAAPGLAWMAVVTVALARVIRVSALFDRGELSALGRAPLASELAEQRLENVVQEMALAAGLPAPRVLVSRSPLPNAAVFGRDAGRATIVIAQGALDRLGRDQLTGVAGQLIGAIANGDLEIGTRLTVTLTLLGLVGRLTRAGVERDAWTPFVLLVRSLAYPDPRGARALAAMLADPLGDAKEADTRQRANGKLSWRDWLRMPLMGPLVLTGFLCAMISGLALAPMLAFAWRQRKYMADATAVRLTRDPDTLASALSILSTANTRYSMAPGLGHMAVVNPAQQGGLLGGWGGLMFPAPERRLRALARLGAHLQAPARAPGQWTGVKVMLVLVLGLLVALLAGLLATAVWLLVVLSAAMSMLFTFIPLGLLHLLLRWIGHHV